ERRGSLCDAGFDDAAALVEIEAARFGCGVVTCHVMRMVSRFTYGDPAGALEAARRAEPVLGAAFSMPLYVTFVLYRALTLAALHRSLDAAGRADAERTVRAAVDDLTRWSRGCAANFAHQAELVRAELARMTGEPVEAMRAYEAAIDGAREQRIVHLEALACERAGDFYLTSGATSIGLRLLQNAQTLYRVWGAIGKAAYLDELHPGLTAHAAARTSGLETVSTQSISPGTSQRTGPAIDLLPVVKAAQSLSAEMVLPRLLERLMTIVLEYTGAERGWLMLTEGGDLTVAAHAEVDRREPAVPVDHVPTKVELPWSILRYVERTHELVRLEDASLPNPYAGDPYFEAHRRRSILCVPIARLGKLTGMFYLENNLLGGAFRAERLVALEVLAAQTAISIDNSRLYDRSQEAILLRDEFLSIASHELKTPLTPLRLRLEALAEHAQQGTLDDVTSARIARLAESSNTQLMRLTRLIDALLDVSRIQLGELSLEVEPTDLAEIAIAVVEQTRDALVAARCTITLDAPDAVPGTWDRVHLEQAITSLVLNAIKYAPGSPIEIVVEATDDRARLAVTDRGIGIAAEDLSRIFDRFERVRSAANVGGLGLGLFLARQVIVAHGGTLEVKSRPGVATSFVIDLPRTPLPKAVT
ncbi:MAG: GAF domain-containing sensor histidine kinase, partial [Myxococcota bacterium]|nr:GAF domain-containing sensor histidine kinase [Myxococcota bacterium]